MADANDVAMAARVVLRSAVEGAPRGAQARLARELGVSPQTVSSWLSGDLAIQPKWFRRLEGVLSIDQWSFADATGLAEALSIHELDFESATERWELVFPSGDPDVLPPRRENRGYKAPSVVAELERRLSQVEEELAAAKGGNQDRQTNESASRPSGVDPEPDAP